MELARPALWNRFTIELVRILASRGGMSERAWRQHVRVAFAKVAEFQARGLVHFHAIIRLDESARVFAGQLYNSLGFGFSLGLAFKQARQQVALTFGAISGDPTLVVADGIDADELVIVSPHEPNSALHRGAHRRAPG